MNGSVEELSTIARRAARARDWQTVHACARKILQRDAASAEGYFLGGLAEKAAGRGAGAVSAFGRALTLDPERYDAAVELAAQYAATLHHGDAAELLGRYEARLGDSPLYLDLAGSVYTRLGLHARAWNLYRRANALQPETDRLQANLAACAVIVGEIDVARALYRELLQRNPTHQRYHYELARLATAADDSHLNEMLSVLEASPGPPEKNIFLDYAIGKELEDLERWNEAFEHYRRAGDAAASVSGYDVQTDIDVVDEVIRVCTADWLSAPAPTGEASGPQPIFVVGLPRSGTTLTERMLASHSQVQSADETFFMPIALQQVSGTGGTRVGPDTVREAARHNPARIAARYLALIRYRLEGHEPWFVDKLPENFLYLGFIARAFPQARLVLVRRHPLDVCFAMYKQSYFRYAYTLDDLGRYYVAFDRLCRHWRLVLGDRLNVVRYEALVNDFEGETRRLLDGVGLPFEEACLRFEENRRPSATASAVQVREKIYRGSVGRWQRFERQLAPLRRHLDAAGIAIE